MKKNITRNWKESKEIFVDVAPLDSLTIEWLPFAPQEDSIRRKSDQIFRAASLLLLGVTHFS